MTQRTDEVSAGKSVEKTDIRPCRQVNTEKQAKDSDGRTGQGRRNGSCEAVRTGEERRTSRRGQHVKTRGESEPGGLEANKPELGVHGARARERGLVRRRGSKGSRRPSRLPSRVLPERQHGLN